MTAAFKFARPAAAAFGIIALVSAFPAFAADVIGEEPPAPAAPMEEPPLNTWSGPYAGVTLGYGFSGRTKDRTDNNTANTDGILGGAFAGYNYQTDNFVVGAEGDIGYSGVEGSNAGMRSKAGVDGSLRARIGYAVTPDILPYITAGGAAQSLKVTEAGGSDSNTMLGWTAGVGTDVKITQNVFGRVEYRYTDFGSDDFTTGAGTHSVKASDTRIQYGVGMKF
jgi:outer membrane immunogenic protein